MISLKELYKYISAIDKVYEYNGYTFIQRVVLICCGVSGLPSAKPSGALRNSSEASIPLISTKQKALKL